jgi:hypothetical protein
MTLEETTDQKSIKAELMARMEERMYSEQSGL